MTKTKKSLSAVFALLLTIFTFVSSMPAQAAKAPIIPQVQFVGAPTTEYTVGDRVRFDISAPNYGGKVEYRVVLWEDSKKTYHDLWNSSNGYPNRYYTKWQPWGNNVFTLGWPINEPGNYRITVYAKRVGVSNNKAFLKGQNCDSYKESVAFTVKPKLSALESVLNKEGQVYGSNEVNNPLVAKNSVYIMAKNITLANASIEGDLYISADNATVKNVTVTGTVFVNPGVNGVANLESVTAKNVNLLSGGKDSIHLKSVTAGTLTVSSSSNVRVELTGTTKIGNTIVTSYAILDSKAGTFGTVTITKNLAGEYTVELRGTFVDPIIVETAVDLKVTEGTTVKTIDAKVAFDLVVEKGAEVNTLDTNGNNVVVGGEGTIIDDGSDEEDPVDPPTPVYDANEDLNTAIEYAISLYNNNWNLLNIEKIAELSTSTDKVEVNLKEQKSNTIYVTVDNRFKDDTRTLKEFLFLGKDKVLAKGPLSNGGKAELLFNYLNARQDQERITVDGTPINKYVADKLVAKNKLIAAAFLNNPSVETYNALFEMLSSGQYDEYLEILNVYNEMFPTGQVNAPKLNVYGFEFSKVLIGSHEIYNSNTGKVDFEDLAVDVKEAIGYDGRFRDITLNKLVENQKTITLVFKDKNVEYKYNIKFNGFAEVK